MKRTMLLALGLTVALVAAGCGGGNTSKEDTSGQSSTSTSQNENTLTFGPVMSYEEYMAADLDSQVTIETYVQAKQSWWEDKATLYTQDEDGAYFIYNVACSQEDYDKLTPGTKIQVTGYKTEWSGEVEIMDGVFQIVEGGDTYVAEPLDVTELLSSEDLINHQNQLVSFKGLTVEASRMPAALSPPSCTTGTAPAPTATTCTSMSPTTVRPTPLPWSPICATTPPTCTPR